MKSLTFVEIDIPVCTLTYGVAPCTASVPSTGDVKCFNCKSTCQDRVNYDEEEVTLRFAKPVSYLPADIDIVAPSIAEVSFTPATISLGENLGTRATLNVVFKDHKDADTAAGLDPYFAERDYDPYEQGTFWGKFRARQPFLRGRAIRWITGLEGQAIGDMETRHFVIESYDGPTPDGKYTLVAKDPLKLVDGDRSQAPVMNTGYLAAPITNVATSATLSPAGIGDDEYPLTGHVVLGGKEVAAFTRWQYGVNGENDFYTKIMLHMDGSNGGATFSDANLGGSAHTWTTTSATTGTTAKKFGTAALVGATGYITTPAHADFNVGTQDFAVDFWFNNNGVGTPGYGLCGQVDSSATIGSMSFMITRQATTGVILVTVTNAGASAQIFFTGTTSFTGTSTWNHIALTKSGTSFRLFVNGVQEDTTKTLASVNSSSRPFTIGRAGDAGTGFSALIDEFRLSVGTARWTSNFTPPATAYTNAGVVSTGDVLTLTARGQMNTVAASAAAQDRVQVVLDYASQDPADIIYDLMVNYAGVPAGWINLSDWQNETGTFLARLYSANICEPTSVATLISEIIQQCCLVVWWDDVARKIRLQVLRGIVTDAARFSPENTLAGTLTVKEQPDKRVSRVQVYFGRINPLKQLSDLDNYRSNSLSIDDDAEEDYGAPVIKTILSRWIPALGRTVADRLGVIQLARFRDPPRRVTFDVQRYAGADVALGGGYRVASQSLQDASGAQVDLPVQVTRLNAPADRFKAEAEEVRFASELVDTTRYIVVDTNATNINLRAAHDSLYSPPHSGDVVVFRVNAGVRLTSTSAALPSLDIGSWPSGVDITVIVEGVIQAAGGRAGDGHLPGVNTGQTSGQQGGTAIYARYAFKLEVRAGSRLWSGGGGGGGGASFGGNGGGGGGGAGDVGGVSGFGNFGQTAPGTDTTPGPAGFNGPNAYPGGIGGGPGLPGAASVGSLGGAAGYQIDGASFATVTVNLGDRRGPTIN